MKRKGKVPRFKLQRRLLTELPGLGKAGALERKPYPPGQHGAQRIKYSDYRLQLEEKQKIKYHYNLRDEQLIRLVKLAQKKPGVWVGELISLLESRLENVLFRGGFARSQTSAAQMISHGQVLVNGRKVNIRSFTVKTGDVIVLTDKGIKNQIYQMAKVNPRLPIPDWIEKTESEFVAQLEMKDRPQLESVPFAFEETLVTSFYSKV